MTIDSDELKVLEAGLALTLLEIPGVYRLSAREAMERVKIVPSEDGKLQIYISIDITPEASLSDIRSKIVDFVDRLLRAYFEAAVDYELTLEVDNVKE